MYLVVSHWEPLPGREDAFEQAGKRVGAVLRQQPGVVFVEAFLSGGRSVAVHGYRDEATYRAVVHDPTGAFARAVAESHLEDVARWLASEAGETVAME